MSVGIFPCSAVVRDMRSMYMSHKCWCFPYDRGDVVMVYGWCRVPVSEFVVYAYGVWWVWKVQAIEVVVVIGVCYKCGVV